MFFKDIEGLRALLNEFRWPNIRFLRPFVSKLFCLFVDSASDVDEVKQLMWDFAATDNRAYIADSVTLLLLERIIREQDLQSASTYAKHHRDLFLVRPPVERKKKDLIPIYSKLFITSIKYSDPKSTLRFIDLLVELGYLERNDEVFSLCLEEELKRFFLNVLATFSNVFLVLQL